MTAYLNFATTAWPRRPEATAALLHALRSQPRDLRHSLVSDRDLARERVGRVLGVPPEHVYFAADATTAANMVVHGSGEPGRRLRVVVDNRGHNAVLRPAHHVGDLTVADLYRPDDRYDPTALDGIGGADLVVLTHTSNVTGSVHDVERAVADVRGRLPGARVMVDASQSAGAVSLAPALAADYVVFPGHKHLAAPPGAAVLLARAPLRDWLTGGTGTSTFALGMPAREGRHLVEVGSGNAPAELALAAALEVGAAGHGLVRHQAELMWEMLSTVDGIRLLGRPPGADRTAIMAFVPEHGTADEWVAGLRHRDIVARGGLQCSPLHHRQLGLAHGTVRFSPGWATADEEIDQAVEATRELAAAMAVLHG